MSAGLPCAFVVEGQATAKNSKKGAQVVRMGHRLMSERGCNGIFPGLGQTDLAQLFSFAHLAHVLTDTPSAPPGWSYCRIGR
jgi:hypothetical protein